MVNNYPYGDYREDYAELKEMLCEELKKIVKKGELSAGSLDIVDKITHSIKSIETIMAMNGYSNRRDSMGRYSRRGYSREYSRDGSDLVDELHDLMHEAPEDMKQDFKRLISKIESR